MSQGKSSSNHPRRTKPLIEGTPTPEEITKAREAANMTPQQAADLIWHTAVQWLQWESGERRMHPCTWWAFQRRVEEAEAKLGREFMADDHDAFKGLSE